MRDTGKLVLILMARTTKRKEYSSGKANNIWYAHGAKIIPE
jgi:hypothetical protein